MYNFLAIVLIQLVFTFLDYIWNSIASYHKANSRWKDCPRDLDFWHSVHGALAAISLLTIIVIFARIRMNYLNQRTLLITSICFQLISLYWLILGFAWIDIVISKDKECLPDSPTEVYLTYLAGVGLWILECLLLIKCSTYLKLDQEQIELAREVINKLEEVEIQGENVCAICLDGLSLGIILEPCRHSFHKECVMRWIETSQTCPYCRAAINI